MGVYVRAAELISWSNWDDISALQIKLFNSAIHLFSPSFVCLWAKKPAVIKIPNPKIDKSKYDSLFGGFTRWVKLILARVTYRQSWSSDNKRWMESFSPNQRLKTIFEVCLFNGCTEEP